MFISRWVSMYYQADYSVNSIDLFLDCIPQIYVTTLLLGGPWETIIAFVWENDLMQYPLRLSPLVFHSYATSRQVNLLYNLAKSAAKSAGIGTAYSERA